MKLGKLAAGATALALSLALVPSVASAAESASADTKFGFWSDAQKTQSLYYSTKMTVSAARDLNALHYGDKLKVTFSKVTNPENYDHSPESATADLGVFTKEMSFGKAEGNTESFKTSIAEQRDKAISNSADTSFEFEIPCSLGQQTYYMSSNLMVTLSDADNAKVTPMQPLGGDPERIYANVPFTISDPEGAAKCAADGKAKPGKDSQPSADQSALDQKASDFDDKQYGDNLTRPALANRTLVKDRYVTDIDKLLQQDAQKYAALEPYKKQISDALASADKAINDAKDPLSDSATKNAMAKFRRAYLNAWLQALKIQNPELAEQYQALQRLYFQAKTSGNSQLVNEVTEMQSALNKAWPAWFSPDSTAANTYSYMVINAENKDLAGFAKTVNAQIKTLKAQLAQKGGNTDNSNAKQVTPKPANKPQQGSLARTGAFALLVSALAGTLVAAGSGITYLSRRSKQ